MKNLPNIKLFLPLLTAGLLAGCGNTAGPQAQDANAKRPSLTAQADTSVMKAAEVSGRIGAWASGRIGAWASGQELDASTLTSGAHNTFSENLAEWKSIHLAEAQQLAPNLGNGVVVAVIDTGIDLSHPFFQGHLTAPSTWYDMVSGDANPTDVPTSGNAAYGHGTAVAGVVLQLAPNARIMPIRAMNADGSGLSTDLARAVDWAASHGAQVINLSATSGVDTVLSTALQNAAAKGIYITLAAGNEGLNRLAYPARNSVQPNALGQYGLNAGATDSQGSLPAWSNYGNGLEISAPGSGLATAMPGGKYAVASGTSFAAPVLAGTLALALGQPSNPAFVGKLAQQIDVTGTNIDALNTRLFTPGAMNPLGSGLLNAQAFLKSLQ